MEDFRFIWRHEVGQADSISRELIHKRKVRVGWGVDYLPKVLLELIRSKRQLSSTCKNLLFTKKKAFRAAMEIVRGADRSIQVGHIEIETKELLDREKKGFYTEKVRRRQLQEIELLLDHYLGLMRSQGRSYEETLREAYPTKRKYLVFLQELEKAEASVIHAAIAGVRKGNKKDRTTWFQKLQDATRSIRREEAKRLFPTEEFYQ
ncbi:MAG: NF038143 family protein [Desulfatiglandales bacterium]